MGGDEFRDRSGGEPVVSGLGEDAMGHRGTYAARTMIAKDLCCRGQSPRSFGYIVDQQNIPAFYFTDDVDRFDCSRAGSFFGHQTKSGIKHSCISRGHLHSTHVRRAHRQVLALQMAQVFEENGRSIEMIDRDVEKALNLL